MEQSRIKAADLERRLADSKDELDLLKENLDRAKRDIREEKSRTADASKVREVIDNGHSSDIKSTNRVRVCETRSRLYEDAPVVRPGPRVCVSIHPEGKSSSTSLWVLVLNDPRARRPRAPRTIARSCRSFWRRSV